MRQDTSGHFAMFFAHTRTPFRSSMAEIWFHLDGFANHWPFDVVGTVPADSQWAGRRAVQAPTRAVSLD
jgi:hypothetical protein